MFDRKFTIMSAVIGAVLFLATACDSVFDDEVSEEEILLNADGQIGAVLFAEDENSIGLNWREDNLYLKFYYEDGASLDVNSRDVNGVGTNNDILVKATDPEKNVSGISGRLETKGSGSGYIVFSEGEVVEDDILDYFEIENELTRTDTFEGDDLIEFEIGDVN